MMMCGKACPYVFKVLYADILLNIFYRDSGQNRRDFNHKLSSTNRHFCKLWFVKIMLHDLDYTVCAIIKTVRPHLFVFVCYIKYGI